MRNRLIILALVCICSLSFVSFNAATAAVTFTGTYGDLTYENTDGKITITDCDASVTSVEIPESIDDSPVIAIGDSAFSGCNKLTSITLPNSITSIRDRAFSGCSGLTSITLPNSITSIRDRAFSGCSGLTSITLPDSLTSIGTYAFSGCSGLTSITLPNSITSIRDRAFSGCSGLTSITLPDSLTSIGGYAFYGCSGLTSITLPDSLTSIGGYAFYGCSRLIKVTLSDSIVSIGNYAFTNCSSLVGVYISDLAAYLGCSYAGPTANPMSYATLLYLNGKLVSGDVVIPDGVTHIPYYAFHGLKITSVTIPASVTSIEKYAFYNCSSLTAVNVTDIGAWCTIDFDCGLNYDDFSAQPLYYASKLYLDEKLVTDLTIPDGITSIKKYAFCGCNSLTSVTIPDSATSIGYAAFELCSNLTSITIPNSITSIKGNAFYKCTSLTAVNITDLDAWCTIEFSGIYSQPLYYAPKLYLDEKLVTDLTIPDSVTSIKKYAFCGCDSLIDITFPDSIASIGEYAFYGCGSLTDIAFPDSITSIGEYAFYDCDSLTDITFPDSITSIGAYTFYNCGSLSNINFPDSVTSIEKCAFSYCGSLRSVVLSSNITSIALSAFYKCNALEMVYFVGTEGDWEIVKALAKTGNDALTNAPVTFASRIILIDIEGQTKSTICETGKALSVSNIEQLYKHYVTLYTNAEMTQAFDLSTVITAKTQLYIRLGAEILAELDAQVASSGTEVVTTVETEIEGTTLLVAAFYQSGRMIRIEILEIPGVGTYRFAVPQDTAVQQCKIFLMESGLVPLASCKELSLQ